MKLLSVSRSFVSGKNQSGRYRMAEQGLLPKFAQMGGPISLAPKRHPEEPLAQRSGAASSTKTGAFGSALAPPAATNWFRLRKSPFTACPAETIRPRLPLQTDLSLDAVKPVRNDLSDADLEVVHSRPAPNQAGPPAPSRSGLFKSHRPGFVWSRLTARLFHSERIRV